MKTKNTPNSLPLLSVTNVLHVWNKRESDHSMAVKTDLQKCALTLTVAITNNEVWGYVSE